MSTLKEKLSEKIPVWRDEIKSLIKEHGDKVISQVTVAQASGGQRGVKCLVCDTSVVDPDKGVTYRGIPIGDLTDKAPEEVFSLLCTGFPAAHREAPVRRRRGLAHSLQQGRAHPARSEAGLGRQLRADARHA
jgi:citrate synthase